MGEAKRRRERQVYVLKIDESYNNIISVRRTLEEAKADLIEWCKRYWEEDFFDPGEEIPPIPEDEAGLLFSCLPQYWGIFGPLDLDGEPIESDCPLIEDLDDLGVDTSKFIDDEDEPALP